MDDKDEKRLPKDEAHEKLKAQVAGIIRDGFVDMKKQEMRSFVSSLDPMMKSIDALLEEEERKNTEIKLNIFKHKIALITFNGVLLALMVGSKDKISFGFLTFSLLFFSIIVGLLQIIIYYFKNEYSFIDGTVIRRKLRAISELCKLKKEDENIINDAKAFIRNIMLENKKIYDNVPALLKDIDKNYNVTRIFSKTLLFEMLFYIPFVVGFALVIYELYFYIS